MIKRGIRTNKLAEIGKIKIGGKGATRNGKNGAYQLPERYGHFVITTTERGEDGNFLKNKEIMESLGEAPKELKIRLLFDDIDMNFFTSFALYQGATCRCRGDGVTAKMLFEQSGKPEAFTLIKEDGNGKPSLNEDGKIIVDGDQKVTAGELRLIKCDPETCPMMQPDANGATRCKPSGILSCVLEDFPQFGGVYRFRSHSWNTISNILSSLEFIKTISGGVLVGLPLKLQIVKKSTTIPVTGKPTTITMVNIIFDGKDYQAIRKQALIEMKSRKEFGFDMIAFQEGVKASGFDPEENDTAEDISAEFYVTALPKETPPEKIKDRASSFLEAEDAEIETEEENTEEREDKPSAKSEDKKEKAGPKAAAQKSKPAPSPKGKPVVVGDPKKNAEAEKIMDKEEEGPPVQSKLEIF